MDHDEIVRLYGPWATRTPADVAALLAGYDGRWWIAGGWAIELATGVARPHGDIDVGIPHADAARLRDHVLGRLDAWEADAGALRPFLPPTAEPAPTCGNLWLRAHGAAPWEVDVMLEAVDGGTWTCKRDARVQRPLTDVLLEVDGLRVLRPEVQLLLKAKGRRDVDEADLRAVLPMLDADARAWLREALAMAHPGHAWIAALD